MRGAAGKGSTATIMVTLTSAPSREWSAHLSSAGRWSWGRTWTSTPESVALGPACVTTVGPRQHSISYKWVDVVNEARNWVCVEGRCTRCTSIQCTVWCICSIEQYTASCFYQTGIPPTWALIWCSHSCMCFTSSLTPSSSIAGPLGDVWPVSCAM